MTTTSEATKRPWCVGDRKWEIFGENRLIVETSASSSSVEHTANAALIVRAVNAHDALVAACERLVEDVEHGYRPLEGCLCVGLARTALALAKGEEQPT